MRLNKGVLFFTFLSLILHLSYIGITDIANVGGLTAEFSLIRLGCTKKCLRRIFCCCSGDDGEEEEEEEGHRPVIGPPTDVRHLNTGNPNADPFTLVPIPQSGGRNEDSNVNNEDKESDENKEDDEDKGSDGADSDNSDNSESSCKCCCSSFRKSKSSHKDVGSKNLGFEGEDGGPRDSPRPPCEGSPNYVCTRL